MSDHCHDCAGACDCENTNLSNKIEELDFQARVMALQKRVDELESSLKAGFTRVSWQDKVSEAGIQIAGGPTTVERTGTVVGTFGFPSGPSSLALFFVIKRDGDNVMAVVGVTDAKILS